MTQNADYQATFDLIDVDKDGRITAAELKNLISALGGEVSDEMAEQAVNVIDTDNDGLVSLSELADYLGENAPPRS